MAWPDFPVAIAGVVLFAAGALLMAQLFLLQIKPGRPMKLCPALIGVVKPVDKIPLSTKAFLSGRYQAAYAQQIGTYEPYFPVAVRLRNQVEYSVFGVLPPADMVYGSNFELLQAGYIGNYCTRNIQQFMRVAPGWADKILRMQTIVQGHGQSFLYVITPSKVALYPEDLPAGGRCPAPLADRAGLIPAWVKLLRQKNIQFVDTTSLLVAAKADYPFPLFPRGGIHWNQVGSAIGALGVDAGIAAQRRNDSFTPFSFTWKMSSHPTGMDADLAQLMNLFWLPDKYANVPVVIFIQSPAPAGCHKIRVVIVGGSFMESIGAVLSRLPCVKQVVEYYYWHANRLLWVDGAMTSGIYNKIDPAQRDAELRRADVVIYEENESLLFPSGQPPDPSSNYPGPAHGGAFYQWVTGGK
jgi:hypothetical protein